MNTKEQLQEVSDKLAQLDPNNRDNLVEIASLEQKRDLLKMQIADETSKAEQEAAQQVRIQAQEEKVATLTLPYDFNELYGDTTANDSIVEVVQIFLREANDEHNNEIAQLTDAHKEEIRASSERELQLKRQNDELQTRLESVTQQVLEKIAERDNFSQRCKQAEIDKQDAESKRDAAVRDKESAELLLAEKQAHIDTLRAEIAVGASKAINVTAIEASDRLAKLVEQSKNAKIKSAADLALENAVPFRGKVEVSIPTVEQVLPFPGSQVDQTNVEPSANPTQVTIPAIPEVKPVQEVQFPKDSVQSGNEMDHGAPSTDGQSQSAVTREEHEALKARVDNIENKLNVQQVA